MLSPDQKEGEDQASSERSVQLSGWQSGLLIRHIQIGEITEQPTTDQDNNFVFIQPRDLADMVVFGFGDSGVFCASYAQFRTI